MKKNAQATWTPTGTVTLSLSLSLSLSFRSSNERTRRIAVFAAHLSDNAYRLIERLVLGAVSCACCPLCPAQLSHDLWQYAGGSVMPRPYFPSLRKTSCAVHNAPLPSAFNYTRPTIYYLDRRAAIFFCGENFIARGRGVGRRRRRRRRRDVADERAQFHYAIA